MSQPSQDIRVGEPLYPVQSMPLAEVISRGATAHLKQEHVKALRKEANQPGAFSPDEIKKILSQNSEITRNQDSETIFCFNRELALIEAFSVALLQAATDQSLPETELDKRRKIFTYCNEIAQKPENKADKAVFQAVKAFFGHIIFLLETNPTVALDLPRLHYQNTVMSSAKKECQKAIETIKNSLDLQAQKEKTIGITCHQKFYESQLSKEIARVAISSTGFFNSSMVSLLIETLKLDQESSKILSEFLSNPLLCRILEETQEPSSKEAASFVFAILDLSGYETVSRVDVQRALFASLLQSVPQVTKGEIPKLVRAFRLDKCVSDMRDILTKGYIERSLVGKQQKIDYLLDNEEASLHTLVKVDSTGIVDGTAGFIKRWNAGTSICENAGLQRAMRAMGLTEDEANPLIQKAIAILGGEQTTAFEVSANLIIVEVAKLRFVENEVEWRIVNGQLGFHYLTCNPAVQAWEKSLRTIEVHDGIVRIHGKLLQIVQSTLYNKFRQKNISESFVKKIFNNFLVQFNSVLKVEYHPGLEGSKGSYALKDIKSVHEFNDLVAQTLQAVVAPEVTDSNEERLVMLMSKVQAFINTSLPFAKYIRSQADETEVNQEGLERSEAFYEHSPAEFLKSYLAEHEEPAATFKPSNAVALLENLIDFAKNNKLTKNERFEIVCPLHTSTLLLDHESLTRFNLEDQFAGEWMMEYEKTRKREFMISQDRVGQIIDWIGTTFGWEFIPFAESMNLVKEGFDLPFHKAIAKAIADAEAQVKEDQKAKEKPQSGIFLSAIRHAIFDTVRGHATDLDKEAIASFGRKLDLFIFKNCFKDDFKHLNPIHFANTYWEKNGQPVHLCFFQDPITKGTKLGTILANGTGLRPLNQEKWVESKPWLVSKTAITAPEAL